MKVRHFLIVGLAWIVGSAAWSWGSGAGAQAAANREAVRLTLLDFCVMTEWGKRKDKTRVADECKCASARTAGALTAAQVKAFDKDLNGAEETVWANATKACFKRR